MLTFLLGERILSMMEALVTVKCKVLLVKGALKVPYGLVPTYYVDVAIASMEQ